MTLTRLVAPALFLSCFLTGTSMAASHAPSGAPVADAGGPYTGEAYVPVAFYGGGSSDPDMDPITYSWNFGDGSSGIGANPSHTYVSTATFVVSLTVSDGVLWDTDQTTALIRNVFGAVAYVTPGNETIRIPNGRPRIDVQVEPEPYGFQVTDVDLTCFTMIFPLGTQSSIPGTAALSGDRNHNGIPEITATFALEDLTRLFGWFPEGMNLCDVQIQARHNAGNRILSEPFHIWVAQKSGTLALAISPNPFNPDAEVSFTTTRAGALRVSVFDVLGRLVKTIANERVAAPGRHSYRFDGRDRTGRRLPSGVYYVQVSSDSDGSEVRRAVVAK